MITYVMEDVCHCSITVQRSSYTFMGHLSLANDPEAQRNMRAGHFPVRAISVSETAAAQVPAREVRDEQEREFVEVPHDDFYATFGDLSSFSPAAQARIRDNQTGAASFFDTSVTSIAVWSGAAGTALGFGASIASNLAFRWYDLTARGKVVLGLGVLVEMALGILSAKNAVQGIASLRDAFLKSEAKISGACSRAG